MPAWGFDNFAQNATPTGSPMTNAQLTIPLVSSSAFAALAAGLKTAVLVQDTGPLGVGPSKFECMLCTGNNTGTNTLTVDPAGRGFGGTTAQSFAGGATVTQVNLKEVLTGAFARLDTGSSQTLTGPLVIPPSSGGTAPPTSYGTLLNKIDEQVLSVTSPSIVIPPTGSLASGYRNLLIRALLRSDQAGAGAQQGSMRLSGDTGPNYATQRFDANGTVLTGASTTGGTFIDQWFIPQNGVLANFFGYVEIWINDYASTTKIKTGRINWMTWQSGTFTGASMNSDYTSFIWNSTAAVTSVTLAAQTGNLLAASEAFTYGAP